MLRVPPNVYVTGTINIDETTHAVSPKVLDRAFTIEVTADRFGSYAPTKEVGIDRDALRTAFQQDGAFLAGSERHLADLETDAPIYTQWLQRLSDALAPYDLHFGHRTYREILSFTGNAISAPWYDGFNRDRDRAFDAACLSKVLPKLSGGRQRTYDPLRIALAWAIDPDSPDEEAVTVGLQTMEWTPTSPRLAGTAGKALRMLRQSTRTGFASFA
jgi:5-methylcytosine-specific restriction endonuclease McrBC GTP-binding regulatory subunit McrB